MKLCKDCKYVTDKVNFPEIGHDFAECLHPSAVSWVTGEPYHRCRDVRSWPSVCGPDASLWEAK